MCGAARRSAREAHHEEEQFDREVDDLRPADLDYGTVETVVADRARLAANRIRGHEKAAAVEIGKELIAIKESLPHGQFLVWIEAEFGYSRRTATNLMQVAA